MWISDAKSPIEHNEIEKKPVPLHIILLQEREDEQDIDTEEYGYDLCFKHHEICVDHERIEQVRNGNDDAKTPAVSNDLVAEEIDQDTSYHEEDENGHVLALIRIKT